MIRFWPEYRVPEGFFVPVRRKPQATLLQTNEERNKMRGRAFAYARQLLLDRERLDEMKVGRSPFAHIDAETIAQKAWADGYVAALLDVRKHRG